MNRASRQQGVALISVLFVVVIMTILISQLFSQSRHDIKRSQWLVEHAQAHQYALGGEQLARQILHEQIEAMSNQGLSQSPIPGPPRRYQPEQGTIRLQLIDLQGRLNLNNIASSTFQPLLNRALPPQLNQALADWVDADALPRPGGAEDSHYMSADIGYRTGNRLLADPSELYSLSAADTSNLQSLLPWFTALDTPTPLNINSAPAALLALIEPGISAPQLDSTRLSSSPPTNGQQSAGSGFATVGDFLRADATAGLTLDANLFTTESTYYAAQVLANAGNSEVMLESRFRIDSATGALILIDRHFLLSAASKQQLIEDSQDNADAVDSSL